MEDSRQAHHEHIAYLRHHVPRRVLFIIGIIGGAQGSDATKMKATRNVVSEPSVPEHKNLVVLY